MIELDEMAALERSLALDALSKDDLILLVISRERELYQHTLPPTVVYQEWPWYGKLACYAAFLFFVGTLYLYGRCS